MQVPKGTKKPRNKPVRRKDPKHLAYVAEQDCCCCGGFPVVVHHLRSRPADKIGSRDDKYTIPICPESHNNARGVHGAKPEGAYPGETVEHAFLRLRGVDGLLLAEELWRKSHGETYMD